MLIFSFKFRSRLLKCINFGSNVFFEYLHLQMVPLEFSEETVILLFLFLFYMPRYHKKREMAKHSYSIFKICSYSQITYYLSTSKWTFISICYYYSISFHSKHRFYETSYISKHFLRNVAVFNKHNLLLILYTMGDWKIVRKCLTKIRVINKQT